jgi:methylmalonyl-CoA mutase
MAGRTLENNHRGFSPELTFDEFPPHSLELWRKETEKQLKGMSFEKSMFNETYEGIQIKALYTNDDIVNIISKNNYPGGAPFRRGTKPAGYVSEPREFVSEYGYHSVVLCREAIARDFKRGGGSISVLLDRPTRFAEDPGRTNDSQPDVDGLSISTIADIETLLADIDITDVPVNINAGLSSLPLMPYAREFIQKILAAV